MIYIFIACDGRVFFEKNSNNLPISYQEYFVDFIEVFDVTSHNQNAIKDLLVHAI